MIFLDELNEKQKKAVRSTDGYVRCIAGAGSGKTRVIAYRFAYMVRCLGISPSSILCITFTNKAAKEMKNRIESILGEGTTGDFVCTYHAFCLKFLREEIFRLNLANNFSVMDETDALDVLKEIYPELRLTPTERKYKAAIAEIREAKKNFPDYVYYFDDKEQKKPTYWSRIFSAYVTKQRKYNMLDFDDLIYFTLHILNKDVKVLEKWGNIINYIMVDETQDSNRHNWNLINKLSELNKNLFVVGDPDQAIYGWRGAKPEFLVNFNLTHEPCSDIILDENYRSLQDILSASNNLISNNRYRVEKELFTNRKGSEPVLWYHAPSEIEESRWICKKINELKKNGEQFNDIAVLYRSSYSSRYIEQAFMREKIPYAVYGGVRFFERKEIKDALAYLKLIEFKDDFSFLRVINTPKRGLGNAFIQRLKEVADNEGKTLFESLYDHIGEDYFHKEGALFFCKLIKESIKMKDVFSISDMMEYIIDESGLRQTLKDDGDEERMENLKELVASAKLYEENHVGNSAITLETYLQDMALYTNMDYKKEADTVKIMTIHQSKGLEFDNVFICNLSDGVLPNSRAIREGLERGLEEERRIMYVAMTRAKNKLFLTDSCGYNSISGDQKTSSRFIFEIKEYEMDKSSCPITNKVSKHIQSCVEAVNKPKFDVGESVCHPIFGYGNIRGISIRKNCYEVFFDGYGIRKINFDFNELKSNSVKQ